MPTAIKVENVSKAYQLGAIGTGTISRDFERWLARARGKEDPYLRLGEINNRTQKSASGNSIVWSLRELNFEIEQGTAVGIIGRNGAGKSTLLKILSRVTSPTTGKISGKGRIASLLEVGTGFHPELTGRENIFLNGALLGMRRKEIQSKLEEIVDFAGVERYLDTPVKRYSSGMYVRLAFAVAAHLESEILIVDEVLAVGDAEFQEKCLGKMGDISKGEGRTVLFVSHNMDAVRKLCNTGILIDNGRLEMIDTVNNVVSRYIELSRKQLENNTNIGWADLSNHPNKIEPGIGINKVELLEDNILTDVIYTGSNVTFKVHYKLNTPLIDPEVGIVIKDANDLALIGLNNRHAGQKTFEDHKDDLAGIISINFPQFPIFGEGKHYVNLYLGYIGQKYEILENAFKFELIKTDVYNSGKLLDPAYNKIICREIKFQIKTNEETRKSHSQKLL